MNNKNFEEQLPANYSEAFHINAKEKRTALVLNLVALLIMIVVIIVAIIPVIVNKAEVNFNTINSLLAVIGVLIALLLYTVLHELLHGLAYKILTGRKLTFGITFSCAFCGVPDIFVYRKTALIALMAPFTVFTIILTPLTVGLYFVSPLVYLTSALILAMHLGGCIGDLYLTTLLLFKYKEKTILMKDTGPEQFIYRLSDDNRYY